MRRNRVIAGVSAFLLGVTCLWAVSLSIGGRITDVRIAAVGDMNGVRNYAPDSPSGRNGAAITRLVQNNEIDAFLGLGDFQYDTAYCADYVKYWTPLWGGTKPKLSGCPHPTTTGNPAATKTSATS